MHARFAILGALVAAATLLLPSPASADAAVRLNRSSGLNPDGDFVIASGSGFNPNAQLFVMQCRSTSGEDHTCNSIGLQKVKTDAAGNFTANAMRVVARFGATDCTRTPCAIKTSAVAGHADDRSQDRMAAISFRAPVVTTTAPPVATTAPPVATTAPPVATTAPPSVTTTTKAATTTTVEGTTTTAPDHADDEATTTTGGDDDAADAGEDTSTTTDPTTADDDRADDEAAAAGKAGRGGNGTAAVVVGGVAVLGAAGAIAAVAIRRRNATTGPGMPDGAP